MLRGDSSPFISTRGQDRTKRPWVQKHLLRRWWFFLLLCFPGEMKAHLYPRKFAKGTKLKTLEALRLQGARFSICPASNWLHSLILVKKKKKVMYFFGNKRSFWEYINYYDPFYIPLHNLEFHTCFFVVPYLYKKTTWNNISITLVALVQWWTILWGRT